MAKAATLTPINQFFDLTGAPLDAGYLYFGLVSQDPDQFPASMFWDAAGTIPALQPIRTIAGYPSRNGAPAIIYGPDEYSMRVKTSAGITVFYAATLGGVASAASLTSFIASLAATSGATLIGWLRSVTGAVATTLAKWLGWQPLSVFDFCTDAQIADIQSGAATLDHTAPMQAFRDAVASAGKYRKGVVPAGRYKYSLSPNWAIQDAQIVFEGEVFFRYTGVGNAVIFDADAADAVDPIAGFVYNMRFGVGNKVIVECPATALNAVFARSFHHGHVGINVRGAGAASAGLKVNFAVATVFDVTVSVNEAGWYTTAKPAIGIDLDKRGAAEFTSYCYFPNAIVEGPTTGIQLTATLGNLFEGGTSEACSSYGVFAPAGASGDRFKNMDFEANTTADVYSLGTGLEIDSCDSDNQINFGTTAVDCVVKGGRHKTILLDTSSVNCQALDTIYNRSNNGGTFTDGGTNSVVRNVHNKGTGVRALSGTLVYDPPNIASGSAAQAVVTVAGAKLGDYAIASFSISTGSVSISASVIAANTVNVTFDNLSGSAQDLGSGTVKVQVIRQ